MQWLTVFVAVIWQPLRAVLHAIVPHQKLATLDKYQIIFNFRDKLLQLIRRDFCQAPLLQFY
ncbi:hypothetical protein D3C81_1766610 [compost metagenome]